MVYHVHSDEARLIEEIREFFKSKDCKLTPEECDEQINELADPVVVYFTCRTKWGRLAR